MLISCSDLARSHGARTLFEGLSFGIREGERVGLVGPNGAGKSTLLATLAGEPPDRGIVSRRRGLRLGFLEQSPELSPNLTCAEIVAGGLADLELPDPELAGRVAAWLGRTGFTDPARAAGTLSGGWRKRLALARELAREPELLLLDEPTNHLDIEGIVWLEELLVSGRHSVLVVTHDRWLLQNLATRVMELSPRWPGGLFVAAGTYADFLEKREEALRGQESQRDALANRVRREVEWLRRGPKARTTKARARIDQAERMATELADLRQRTTSASAGLDFAGSGRRTKRLLEVSNASVLLDGRPVLSSVDLTILNGQRLGVVGANGSGKTTLLGLLAGEIAPATGSVERAQQLSVVRFEQDRTSLDPSIELKRALAPEGDAVTYLGRTVHVSTWARRFLFRTEQLDVPVGRLSGGEQARILLARLMLRPADLLLLDEPTNDLDIGTLEVLEESLAEYPGALVLVTHDRFLLDRVSTSVVAIRDDGELTEYADLAQWLAARRSQPVAKAAARRSGSDGSRNGGTKPKRLSYLENREWERMEETILEAEEALERCRHEAEARDIATDAAALQERHAALASAQRSVDALYARWAELEAKQR